MRCERSVWDWRGRWRAYAALATGTAVLLVLTWYCAFFLLPSLKHRGRTALHIAAQEGNLERVRLLLHLFVPVDALDPVRDTPLHLAAAEGHDAVVGLLTARGADVNAQNIQGATPITYAAKSGHLPTVQILVQAGAQVNCRGPHGQTPIQQAANRGHLAVVKFLLEHGADPRLADEYGCTPLHEGPSLPIAEALLAAGAAASARNAEGRTPLFVYVDNDDLGG